MASRLYAGVIKKEQFLKINIFFIFFLNEDNKLIYKPVLYG